MSQIERHHLASMERPEGNIWLTLIVESPKKFYVEMYDDSSMSFIRERLKVIQVADFGKYQINGKSLAKLVEEKFDDLNLQSPLMETPEDGLNAA